MQLAEERQEEEGAFRGRLREGRRNLDVVGAEAPGLVRQAPHPQDCVGVGEDGREAEAVAHFDERDGERRGDDRLRGKRAVHVEVGEVREDDVRAAKEREGRQGLDRGVRELRGRERTVRA